MAGVKDLIKQVRDITMGVVKSTGGDRGVDLVRTMIRTMENTLKTIDKYLTDNTPKDIYQKAKAGALSYKEKAKVGISDLKTDIKDKGLKTALKNKSSVIKTKLSDAFKSGLERVNGPPDEGTIELPEGGAKKSLKDSLIDSMTSLKDSIMTLNQTNEKTNELTEEEDKEGDAKDAAAKDEERKRSSWEKLKATFAKKSERDAARAKEVADEKARLKGEKGSKDKGGGLFGGIISALGAVGGVFTKGIGSLLKFLPGLLIKGLGKAIGPLLFKLVPFMAKSLSGVAASGISALAGGALSMAGSAVMAGATAIGGAILSPIGLGVIGVAAALYGGYKLYKYLNRNDLGSGVKGKLTRLRMLSYGFSDVNREHYSKLLDLDMLMQGYVSNANKRAVYKKFDKSFKNKVISIFDIKENEKEKYDLLNNWFIKRYTVAHAAFMHAYYGAGGVDYLDNLEKLSDEQCFNLVTQYRLPTEVHDCTLIPVFESSKSVVTKDEIDVMLTSLRQDVKKTSDAYKGKKTEDIKKQADKAVEQNEAGKKADTDELARETRRSIPQIPKDREITQAAQELMPPAPPSVDPATSVTEMKMPETGTEEGEKEPSKTAKSSSTEKTVSPGKLYKADGTIQPGSLDMTGISKTIPMSKIQNLDPNFRDLFTGMAKEYNTLTGKEIQVNEAHRSYEDQVRLKKEKGAAAAAPGTSLHEFGIAVDMQTVDADALEKLGLMRKYGFTRPIGGETWHIESAGVSLNPKDSRHDMALRKEGILSSPGRGGGGLGTNRNLPKSMKYRRDFKLQNKLFNEGETIESPVEPSKEALPYSVKGPVWEDEPAVPVAIKANADKSKEALPYSVKGPVWEDEPAVPATAKPVFNGALTNKLPEIPSSKKGLDMTNSDKSLAQPNMDVGKYVDLSPKQAVVQASKTVGMDPNVMLAFAQTESSMRPSVRAPTSSATGLFQITDGTWNGLMKKYSDQYNIPDNAASTNPYYNSLLGVSYAKENLKAVSNHKELGVREDTALYLAHHFGPSGAKKILSSYGNNPSMPVQNSVSGNAYNANRQELGGKSISDYVKYLNAKLTKNAAIAGATPQPDLPARTTPQSTENISYPSSRTESITPQRSAPTPAPMPQSAAVNTPIEKPKLPTISNSIPRPAQYSSEVQPQKSQVMTLDKTDSILTGMGGTLIQIKEILEAIGRNASMGGGSSGGSSSNYPAPQMETVTETKPQQPDQKPMVAGMNRLPSKNGISMSRKTVL